VPAKMHPRDMNRTMVNVPYLGNAYGIGQEFGDGDVLGIAYYSPLH
jgi:hypothetical protein